MDKPKLYEWTVKIRVADTLVADGFDLDADRLHAMVRKDLYAYGHEIEAEIVSAPPDDEIAKEQGYASAAARDVAHDR